MKQKILCVCMTLMMLCVGINARAEIASGTCGTNLTWVLSDDGTLTISGSGDMTNWSSSSSVPWYSNRYEVKKIIMDNSVTSIGDRAFYECADLTSITIPNSVTSIGERAFNTCINLTSITIPNSVTNIGNYAFYYCPGLTSVTIPNSVTSISNYAFGGCSSLTSITIPNSVTSIGSYAFSYCSGLTSITLPNSVTSIGNGAFSRSGLTSIDIPNSVMSIGEYAFNNCSGLASVTIGNSVTSIGASAFEDCSGLTSVTYPNSMTSIGWGAFRGCTGLISIDVPNSVTSIENFAFSGCSGLTSVTIPNSVTSIGNMAFSSCSNLNITLKSIGCTLGSSALYNVRSVKVPIGTGETYKAAENWSQYKSIISESREAGALLDEAATTSVVPAAAGDNVDVTLKRALKASEWNTLSLPFSMTAEQVQGVFGEGTQLATLTGLNGSTIYFNTDATTITANQPVLIKPTNISGTYYIEGATVVDSEPSATGVGASLIGNYEPLSGDQGVGTYYLSGGTFYQTQYMTSMKPFRAYLKLNGASSKNFYIGFNAPTGIFDVKANTSDDNAPAYNLEGQRVNGNTKGIVIKNGKKFINK